MKAKESSESSKNGKIILFGIIIALVFIFWPRKYNACECYSYIKSNGTLTSYEMKNMGIYTKAEIDKQDYCLTKYSTKELINCY